jgi:hypothetical protein
MDKFQVIKDVSTGVLSDFFLADEDSSLLDADEIDILSSALAEAISKKI